MVVGVLCWVMCTEWGKGGLKARGGGGRVVAIQGEGL